MLPNVSGAGEYQGWGPAPSGGLCTHTSAGETGCQLTVYAGCSGPSHLGTAQASQQHGSQVPKSELPKRARRKQDQPVRAGFS